MTELELSCGLPPGPDFADLAVLAEELGYDRIWIFDSAPLWEDPFVHLALATQRTSRIAFSTAVLVPEQRSVMAMATAIATIARLAPGRFRACFGTGLTARVAVGQRPLTLRALGDHVRAVRALLTGAPVTIDGTPVRMLHTEGLALNRPIDVPLWLSAFGPRGADLAAQIADGIIGPVHPTLPSAMIMSGTVLDHGEKPDSPRVREAIGPWRVVDWHNAFATGGAAAVDAMPGGTQWRTELAARGPANEHHLAVFEGHVTHLTDRDRPLLEHIDVKTMVGDAERVTRQLRRMAAAGFREIVYTPTGPDIERELRTFAAARPG